MCRPKMDALKRQARKPGRPRLTEGEHPIGVKVNLPAATCKAIDATGRKRSEYIRAAITEKMERER